MRTLPDGSRLRAPRAGACVQHWPARHAPRAGEIHEYKEELRALDKGKRKETVKKVIAAMTVGKDVSMLFPDVVNCMQTDDLELKKLVYLYLINYAKTQPDLAIMGVNTFVKARARTCTRPSCWPLAASAGAVHAWALHSPGCAGRQPGFHTRARCHSQGVPGCPNTGGAAQCGRPVPDRVAPVPGCEGQQPTHTCAGRAHDGLHQGGQDHGVPVRPPAAVPQGAAHLQSSTCRRLLRPRPPAAILELQAGAVGQTPLLETAGWPSRSQHAMRRCRLVPWQLAHVQGQPGAASTRCGRAQAGCNGRGSQGQPLTEAAGPRQGAPFWQPGASPNRHGGAQARCSHGSSQEQLAMDAAGPRQSAAQDDDPYVKKTAAVCVAKLYDINPELVEDRGFLDTLRVSAPTSHSMLRAAAPCQLAAAAPVCAPCVTCATGARTQPGVCSAEGRLAHHRESSCVQALKPGAACRAC